MAQKQTRISKDNFKALSAILRKSKVRVSIPALLDRSVEIALEQLKREFLNGN